MTDGLYLGPDYRFNRPSKIRAYMWAEPEGYEQEEEPTDEQLELFTRDDLHYSF